MPCARTLYNWCRTQPQFAEAVDAACEHRADWYRDQMVELIDRFGPMSERDLQRLLAPLSAQETRLRKRPGWKRRREEA